MPDNSIDKQLQLAREAASGQAAARARVNELVRPIIEYQSSRFCKRFCKQQRFQYQCSLPQPWGSPPADASLCEWGNASYGWMLDDLTSPQRLQTYRGEHGSSLYNYLYQIANSLPFYERWKDWRFGRRVYVPTYIQSLGPLAARVFMAMQSRQSPELMAQSLAQPLAEIEYLQQQITALLTEKGKLHLLKPTQTVSLSHNHDDDDDDHGGVQADIASYDEAPEQAEHKRHLHAAWQQLSPVEQFVLEALVINEQSADEVLAALARLNLGIKDGVAAAQTDRQQLYYFRRKTLARLAQLIRQVEQHAADDEQ